MDKRNLNSLYVRPCVHITLAGDIFCCNRNLTVDLEKTLANSVALFPDRSQTFTLTTDQYSTEWCIWPWFEKRMCLLLFRSLSLNSDLERSYRKACRRNSSPAELHSPSHTPTKQLCAWTFLSSESVKWLPCGSALPRLVILWMKKGIMLAVFELAILNLTETLSRTSVGYEAILETVVDNPFTRMNLFLSSKDFTLKCSQRVNRWLAWHMGHFATSLVGTESRLLFDLVCLFGR